jgi:flagellar biogenesis protein FliO
VILGRGRQLVLAIAVALGGIALTPAARAQQAPAPGTPAAAPGPAPLGVPDISPPAPSLTPPAVPDTSLAAPSPTPLALRPGKPLELAHEPPRAGLGWKVLACIAILCGAAFYARRRLQPARVDDGRLTIVRRTAIGIRSELLVVHVEGQRLLIGVTPHAIQSLAVLDGDDAVSLPSEAPVAAADVAIDAARASVGERFAAMLQAADSHTAGHRLEVPSAADEAALAGQARGLLALRRRG